MLPALLLAVLSQTYQPAPQPWEYGKSEPGPTGIVDMTYPGAGEPAGIPAPTLVLNGADFKPGDATWVDRKGGVAFSKLYAGTWYPWQGSPFYPEGFTEATRTFNKVDVTEGNYWSTNAPGGADVFDHAVAGGFTCVIWERSGAPGDFNQVLIGAEQINTSGWYIRSGTTTTFGFYPGTSATTVVSEPTTPGLHVTCAGLGGGNAWIMNDGNQAYSVASTGYVPASTSQTHIGKTVSFGGYIMKGGISEVANYPVAWNTANVRALQLAAMRCAGAGNCLTDTGASSHISFDTGTLVDTKGAPWRQYGTPSYYTVPSYVWPGIRTPRSQPSAGLGLSGTLTAGDVLDQSTDFTIRIPFKLSSIGGANYLVGKLDASGFLLYAPANYLTLRICSTTTCSNSSSVSVLAEAWYVATVSYKYTEGSLATVILNVNGENVATTTGMPGPIPNTTKALMLGEVVTGGQSIPGVEIWSGWAANATEAALLSRHKMGLMAIKPATNQIPLTRNDVHASCCPVTDAACFSLGPNFPCQTARGLERFGATSNLLTTTDINAAVWSGGSGCVATTGTISPRGLAEAFTWDPIPGAQCYHPGIGVPDGTASNQSVFVRSPAPSDCAFNIGLTNNSSWDGATAYGFTATPRWQRFSFAAIHSPGTNLAGIVIGQYTPAAGQTLVNVVAYEGCPLEIFIPQVTLGVGLKPPRISTGTPYSGPHTDANTAWTNTNPDRWGFSMLATIAASSSIRTLATTTGGTGGVVEMYVNSSNNFFVQPTDGLGGYRAWRVGILYSTPSENLYTAFVRGGEPGGRLNGLEVHGASFSGTWSGSMRANPTTLKFGSSGASFPIEGYVKRVVQCPTERGCQ